MFVDEEASDSGAEDDGTTNSDSRQVIAIEREEVHGHGDFVDYRGVHQTDGAQNFDGAQAFDVRDLNEEERFRQGMYSYLDQMSVLLLLLLLPSLLLHLWIA